MEFNLENVISLITTFQAFLFAAYLLSNNPNRNASNYFMAIFLVTYGIDFAAFYSWHYIYPIAPNIGMILSMTLYLSFPSLFLYIKSSLYSDFKLQKYDLFHLIPFLAINLVSFPFYYLYNAFPEFAPENALSTFNNIVIPVNYFILHALGLSYLTASYLLLRRYKKLFLENFSNADTNKYSYLLQLIIIIAAADLISLVKNFAMFNRWLDLYNYALILVNFVALVMICWIVYKALKSPELFMCISSKTLPVSDIVKENHKGIAKSAEDRTNELNHREIRHLQDYMKESTPYLDPSLTLFSLAKQLNLPSKELSVLINHTMGLHFFDFVNEYRINYAKELLLNQKRQDLTVLEILYDAGFNSKSSFNTEFKKRTGVTPTEYRKKHSLSIS